MKKKAALKMIVDLAMTILFLGQMGYHSARMILDARVEPDGNVSFEIARDS